MPDDLRAHVQAIEWYHSIDLGGGVRTPGKDDSPVRLARIGLPASLEGLSVLDVGAWDGFSVLGSRLSALGSRLWALGSGLWAWLAWLYAADVVETAARSA